MAILSDIEEHMKVVGADGVPVGIVDRLEGIRIKLTRDTSGTGSHAGHHHYLPGGLVADIEGDTVRLTADAATVATLFEEEEDGSLA